MSEGVLFQLGTFKHAGNPPFAAIIVENDLFDLAALSAACCGPDAWAAPTLLDLLEDWERSFETLLMLAETVRREGLSSGRFREAAFRLSDTRVLPPIVRPPKILNAAANYGGHLKEMRQYTQSGLEPAQQPFSGEKSGAEPYLFLKASSALCGAFDDVVIPAGEHRVDWEVELAIAIGPPGKRIKAEQAMRHVAGFMTFNDVSCRTTLWRTDRPNFRTDWLASKSFDTFGPLGPFFVPREFAPEPSNFRLQLSVNGVTMQDGHVGDMIFSPEEQIEYASRFMTLEPGDIFATGTPAGVGQGSGHFLKAGDVMEAEVHGLGRQRNRVVVEQQSLGRCSEK